MQSTFAVALTGADRWLRPKIARRLAAVGLNVREIGSGAATVRGYDVLVYVPPMMPGASGPDIGASQARLTFAAAAQGKVGKLVVVSRVGPEQARDAYLDALRGVEASAARMSSAVTVVRSTHPIGTPDDPGPVVEALRNVASCDAVPTPTVQPVVLADLLDVIEAAVDGRIGAGVIEVGGPAKMPLSALHELAMAMPGRARGRRGTLAALRPGRRRAIVVGEHFLGLDSVAAPRLRSPIGAPCGHVHDAVAP